jgi:predicted nucleotidyltransferase
MLDTGFILTTLQKEKSTLMKEFDIDKIGIFGSYARMSQLEDSDIDVYVEFKQKAATFKNVAGLWNYLENLFHKKVDLVYYQEAENSVIKKIQQEVVYG